MARKSRKRWPDALVERARELHAPPPPAKGFGYKMVSKLLFREHSVDVPPDTVRDWCANRTRKGKGEAPHD